jgi:hypothetical protein
MATESKPSNPASQKALGREGDMKVVIALVLITVVFAAFQLLFSALVPLSAGATAGLTTSTLLYVAVALVTGLIAFGIFAFAMYMYELKNKVSFEERARTISISLKKESTIVRFVGIVLFTAVWSGLIFLFWRNFPMLISFDSGTLAGLLTEGFSPFALAVVAIAAAIIVVNFLYLTLSDKWVTSALETGVTTGFMLLVFWLIMVFPFNPVLSSTIQTVLYAVMVLVLIACVLGTAFNIWYLMKVIVYGRTAEQEEVEAIAKDTMNTAKNQ